MSKNSNLIKFKVAQLCKGKEWFVFYYVINPSTQVLVRKKVKINFIKSIPERNKFAKALMREINEKLHNDWNPFEEDTLPKGYKKLTEALENFLAIKKRELREDSVRTYTSYIAILNDWLKRVKKQDIGCEAFRKIDAVEFLDWAYTFKELSSRTYNNYKIFYTSLWNWLKEKEFTTANHFEKISKKKAATKTRIVIDLDTREQIKNHLEETDYNFLMVSMLVFHALLRPKEVCHMKPKYFDLERQIISVPSHVSKNGKDRFPTISNTLLEFLKRWDFNGAKSDEYIFGPNLLPGKTILNPRRLAKKWDKLRDDLGMQKEMQLYSLRDSGIVQMLDDGISPVEVMKQADHASLEETTKYALHFNPAGSEQIRNKTTDF